MSEISAAAVMKLRNRTGAPMMDCKAALTEAAGDDEKAVEILRKKSASIQAKKADRETAEGRIGVFIDAEKKVGSIVEMRCESAPVVKSDQFIVLTQQVAKQIALKAPKSIDELLSQNFVDDPKKTVTEVIGEVIGLIRESMKPARMTRLEGLLGSYIHHDGSVGVLIQVEGTKADPQLLRDICMHITAKNPAAAKREEVTPEFIEKEKEIARGQAAATGKPAKIVEMIIEGKMKTWFADNVLLEQPFVKDDTKTVGELLKSAGLSLVRYVRYKVGELT
ncbi:MAG TPA: translation elongation factor Ts [Gemmataceae bacterium]|jgi:elongation factor Ts|nr:translation elongation factor Ts [Gemmataceae bacterium]